MSRLTEPLIAYNSSCFRAFDYFRKHSEAQLDRDILLIMERIRVVMHAIVRRVVARFFLFFPRFFL